MTDAHIALEIVNAFEKCGVPCVIGGSHASSAWGESRQTNDIDVAILASSVEQVRCTQALLGENFVFNSLEFDDAFGTQSEYRSGQIYYVPEGMKIDVFVLHDNAYTRSELERTVWLQVEKGVTLPVVAAENIVLHKIRWYVMANRVSDRQWNDLVKVLAVQRGSLDLDYLRKWADHFKVREDLETAIQESRVTESP